MSGIEQTIAFIDKIFYGSEFIIFPAGGALLSFLLLFIIIFLSFHTKIFPEFIHDFIIAWNKGAVPQGGFRKHWVRIQRFMAQDDELSWHQAIIEADDLLDAVLQKSHYAGKDIDERLERANSAQIPYLEEARKAHHVRMYFEHDPSYRISREAAEKVVEIYENIFTALGAL